MATKEVVQYSKRVSLVSFLIILENLTVLINLLLVVRGLLCLPVSPSFVISTVVINTKTRSRLTA
jgi:hypothetical protein